MTTVDLAGWTAPDLAGLRAGGMDARALRRATTVFACAADYLHADPATLAASNIPAVTPADVACDAVALGQPGYPGALAVAPNPPLVLFVAGRLPAVAGVAVVGTRAPSRVGVTAARAAVRAAAAVGAPVVSGGARGVDRAAHDAALASDVPTVAVVASGVDVDPDGLHARVVAAGGAVVSEHPPGTPTNTQRLMARNRIVVGLAAVVVPCEGMLRSGTAGAVRDAVAADRPVIVAVPADRHLPGAELAVALTDPDGRALARCGWTGTAADRLARHTPLANGAATTPGELVELVTVAWRLSPLTCGQFPTAGTDRRVT